MELSFNVEQFVVNSALSNRQWMSWSIILECKKLGPRSTPTWSGSKLFDNLTVFLKEVLEKFNFENE